MFDRINALVRKRGFTLKAWDDRYGKGIWAICTPLPYHGDEICEASSDGDLDMIPATEYILSTEWLPIAMGRNLVEALTELEARLARFSDAALSKESNWSVAVWDALEHFRDVRLSRGDFGELPATLSHTEANTVSRDGVTSKMASLVTTGDELAVWSGQGDGRFRVHPIRAIERGAGGVVIFRHGPVGLAVVEYDADDHVEIVRR
ncbi:hypothetical protein WS63_02985 [Burkholderia stagnalis]|uniref:hypothetical protein n=1 Tax=Burkholderia stagnalis TaxID=1503054 RepID=UPI0007588BFF|nr:hypothetical protein [Burkholderia stagnalis]KVD94629.1 hypothetical protein WS63_02985 [Burkholderia stagnalis]KWN65908.1 hypothetical protein WT90_32975 [Burkholderia stagnalis]